MPRLFSNIEYTRSSEGVLKYLIETRKFKIMHSQSIFTAEFMQAKGKFESGESDLDPRKVSYGWKRERPLTTKEALTAQESGHWLILAKPHIGGVLILDQDDKEYKQALKEGRTIDIEPPLEKDIVEEKSGKDTYIGYYRTPHGYHHVLSQADDPDLAGNGGWSIGGRSGEVRCDRGYVVLYDAKSLAQMLWRTKDKQLPKTNVRKLLGAKDDMLSISEDEPPKQTNQTEGYVNEEPLPQPSITEIVQAFNLAERTPGDWCGPCPVCNEGDTRFHTTIRDGKALFYCVKGGAGEDQCNGVNNKQSIAKIYEKITHRGDGIKAIQKIHRIAKKADDEDVCKAEVEITLSKIKDLTEYQKAWIKRKLWNDWYPNAVMDAEIKKEEDAVKSKARERRLCDKQKKIEKAENRKLKKAEVEQARSNLFTLQPKVIPLFKPDLNAFKLCVKELGRDFRYNVIKTRIEYQKSNNEPFRVIEDHEIDELFMDITERFLWNQDADSDKPHQPVQFGRGDQMTAYKGLVYRNQYNPWKDYLDKIPIWDGTPRIHKSMEMGGMTIEQSPVSAWAQGIAWVDVVRYGIYPGSPRFPEAILLGPAGRGKSSFLSNIMPPDLRTKYFLEGGPPIDSDDKIMIEKGSYILVENKEFGGGGKKDWEKVKEQWDKRIYTARLSYGRTTSTHRRCDTRVHTTNRRQLPEDDSAVSRRFIAVKVTGKVKVTNKKGDYPWSYFDSYVDITNPAKGTHREQMLAEAKAIIFHHGSSIFEDGNEVCNFNYLQYMCPDIATDPEVLLKINQKAGVAYVTAESAAMKSCKESLDWYINVGLAEETRSTGESAGAIYDNYGQLIAVQPRGLYYMMLAIQSGHDDTTAAKLTTTGIDSTSGSSGINSINNIDRENGLTLSLKRSFKSAATGGDNPLFVEDEKPTVEPHDTEKRRFRWMRPNDNC